jgi:hypothetical protein
MHCFHLLDRNIYKIQVNMQSSTLLHYYLRTCTLRHHHHHALTDSSRKALLHILHFVSQTYVRDLGHALHLSKDIRDVHDAHVVLEAVRLNILPLLKRRLLESERDELKSGHVYVWEEAQDDGGLLRWTDGRRW